MKVRLISVVAAIVLALTTLLGPASPASAADGKSPESAGPSESQGKMETRNGTPQARRGVRVIFVKNKKHLRRLNKYIKRKKRRLPRCTRAVRVWRGKAATYSCCAKCKSEAPKGADRHRVRADSRGTTAPRGWCWLPGRCINTYSWWSNAPTWSTKNPWGKAMCVVEVAAFILPAGQGIKWARKLGGIKALAKKIGKGWTAGGALTAILGFDTVQRRCRRAF